MGPERIGDVLVETYRIERLVAEGGMGSVYEARHVRLPKRFAVKFLNLMLIGNHEAQARFRREAEIIAALDHPNIVSLLDYNFTPDGIPFIVLEFLDGEHLGKRIERGKLSLGDTLQVLAPVASALSAAHARDIVHRDLKPENIVLCKDGQVKVVDFGIAKISDGQQLTRLNTILGTVPYMAPEQLVGAHVSALTDQFAMASIVYEMLTGEMAFGGPTTVPEVAARVAHFQPAEVAGVSQAVNAAMFQAMAKDPGARFPSMQAFLEAMTEAAARHDEPTPLPDLGAIYEGLPPLLGEATTIDHFGMSPPRAQVDPFADGSEENAGAQTASLPIELFTPAPAAGAWREGDHGSPVSSAGADSRPPAAVPGLAKTAILDRSAVAPLAASPPDVEERLRQAGVPRLYQDPVRRDITDRVKLHVPLAVPPPRRPPPVSPRDESTDRASVPRSSASAWMMVSAVVAAACALLVAWLYLF